MNGKSSRWFGLIPLALAAIGLFISVTLSLTHVRGAIVPCGGSTGCATVEESGYSQLFGLPVAYIGVAGYLSILALAVASSVSRLAARALIAVTGIGTLCSVALIAISAFVIHATCLWCLGSAGTMACLLARAIIRRRVSASFSLLVQVGFASALVGLAWLGAAQVVAHAEQPLLNQAILLATPFSEMAPDRSPARGDADARITIVEFADFACPACREMAGRFDKLLADTRGIRLVFRNLPQAFIPGHEASTVGAECGEIANESGRFWQFAERAFRTPNHPKDSDYTQILESMGLGGRLSDRIRNKTDAAVKRVDDDLALAHRLRLSVTPVFVVYSPNLAPQVSTNVGLSLTITRPEIIRYLKARAHN